MDNNIDQLTEMLDTMVRMKISDKIDKNIFDRTIAAVNEQLMIFVKDRIKDRKP